MFHDVNLPKFIEIFAVGRLQFSTSNAVSMSGREVRKSDYQIPKRLYSLKNCRLSVQQFEIFNSFFQARAGMLYSFRLRDYFDYEVKKQIIAVGDGATTEFQLQKIYEDRISSHRRLITKPVLDSVKLWSDTGAIEPLLITADTGKIKLSSALANGSRLFASFIFDVPVRFNQDSLQYSFDEDGSIILDDSELIEVYE